MKKKDTNKSNIIGNNMKVIDKFVSNNSNCIKFLQKTDDNLVTETAFIEEENRYIICFASQLGCQIGCTICYNGICKNYVRNLKSEEIIKECSNIVKILNLDKNKKKICFSCMGVGEPLLNYKNVVAAIKELNKIYPENDFDLATTGIKPELIKELAYDLSEIDNFKLTISLHAANDELRRKIIPINVSLNEIKKYVAVFKLLSNHQFEWNYVLLDSINDSKEHALELIYFITQNDFVKISSFNEIDGSNYKKSKNLKEFIEILEFNNINFKIFNSQGTDIEIGCGQMVTHYNKVKKIIKEV